MTNHRITRSGAGFLTAIALVFGAPAFALAQGQIIIVNVNAAGVGFNDPTPATPVGGNMGTTRGQQRLNVFEKAADIWEAALQPTTDIFVRGQFVPLAPGVLGSAGTTFIFRNFPGAEFSNTWYHSALADKLAGVDLNPGFADIATNFSSTFPFYFGLDNNHGPLNDLLPVVLHELGHGLGFANFVNELTGTLFLGGADIFSAYTNDVVANQAWNAMTNAQRQASAISQRKVVWNGLNVRVSIPAVLSPGTPQLTVVAPAGVGPFFDIGPAAFGAPLASPGVFGNVVLGIDPANAAGPSATDGCSALTNPGAVAGNIAILDRGACGFVVKVKNAQNAGAIGVIIADNLAGAPPAGLGGADPTITIPSGRVTLAAGNTIKANIPAIQVNLGVDLTLVAGTERTSGDVLLWSPDPVSLGSSISHWDIIASRNQLMEPAISPDLTSSVRPPEDLTLNQMVDIGWFSDRDGVPDGKDACLASSQRATLVIDGCDSGAPNVVGADGCRFSDLIDQCADGARNHGSFASCVARVTNDWKARGLISGEQKGAIQSCAAGSGR